MTIFEALRSVTTEIKAWVTKRLEGYISTSQVGAANGVAGLDENKKVAAANLPYGSKYEHGIVKTTDSIEFGADGVPTSFALYRVRLEAAEKAVKDWDQSDSTKTDYIKNRPFYRELVSIGVGDKVAEYVTDGPPSYNGIYDPVYGKHGSWEELPYLWKSQYAVDIQIDSTTTERVVCQLTTDEYYEEDDDGYTDAGWIYHLVGDGIEIDLSYYESCYDDGYCARYYSGTLSHNFSKVAKIVIYEYTGEDEYRITPIGEEYLPESVYALASATTDGRMSAGDKVKLDGIAAGANAYSHPTYTAKSSGFYKVTVDDTGHVSGAAAVDKSDITALGIPAQDTTYSAATTTAPGLMSAADKIKLDGLGGSSEITSDDLPVVPIAKGGTGATTAKAAEYNLHSGIGESTNAIADSNKIIIMHGAPSATSGAFVYKQASLLKTYINAMPKSGGTFTAAAKAHVGTDYTTCRLRNAKIDTSTSPSLSNGEIAFVYS